MSSTPQRDTGVLSQTPRSEPPKAKKSSTLPSIVKGKGSLVPQQSRNTTRSKDDDIGERPSKKTQGVPLATARGQKKSSKTGPADVHIGDTDTLREFYRCMFVQMQQIPCKVISRAWIKAIEPKKQSKHPYNGGKLARELGLTENPGDCTRPGWWPEERCRHREPDHIKKGGKY